MNIVVLIGRLTATPELKTTQSGISYCRFSLAVDRPGKSGDEKKTDFFSCVAWRGTAEFIERYFAKGQMIAVNGSLQTGSYINGDGVKVNTVDVLINQAHFCGNKQKVADAETNSGKLSKAPESVINAIDSDLSGDLPF